MTKHNSEPTGIQATEEEQQKGTFYIGVTLLNPQDGSNADTLKIGYWPGTKAGFTPPATFAEAATYALKTVENAKGLACAGVCEIRITTYAQGGDDDPVTFLEREVERLENLALEDDCYRCDRCERVWYMDDMAHAVTRTDDDSESICKECAGR